MKIIVDTANYTPFKYDEYFDGGSPENNPYSVGQVVVITQFDENCEPTGRKTLGVVLGVLTPNELRTDSDGMVAIEDIRPANIEDFNDYSVDCCDKLRMECSGLKVKFDWETFEVLVEE
jgi:hypothetical protein